MARKDMPTIEDGLLLLGAKLPSPEEQVIVVGSNAWYAWLELATAFTFVSEKGKFTARKEHFRRGGWYWRAYRRHHGRLMRMYLGKSEQLNLKRLDATAWRFATSDQQPSLTEQPVTIGLVESVGGDIKLDANVKGLTRSRTRGYIQYA